MRYMSIFLFLLFHQLFGIDPKEYFERTQSFKQAFVGIYIENLKTEEVVCALNENHLFCPASIQKVLTSYAALSLLKENFRYQTDLEIEGYIDSENHTLHGNVWIRGGGDPTLKVEIIDKWANALKEKGIQKIEGKIIADASRFETMLSSPYWYFEDLGSDYGAGACALNINQNVYEITFQPGEEEELAKVVSMEPQIPYLTYFNEVVTADEDTNTHIAIYGSDYSPFQYYRGCVASSKDFITIKGSISDPPLVCASLLAEKIETSQGVEVLRYPRKDKKKCFLVDRHISPHIFDIIKEMNTFSINLYAEQFVKVIGKGSGERGINEINSFYTSKGISQVLKDGSGLARTNYLSPKEYVRILKMIYKDPSYPNIYNSLPEIGKNGKEYAFCMICNHYPGKISEIKQAEELFLQDFVQENLQ